MPYIGTSPSQGVRRVHTYTATANQTSFSGAGAEGATLSYKDSNFVDVYQNGVKLGDADYTATSGTAIVLGTGATVSDLVVIVAYDVFSAADTVSKADGGQFDGNVTMTGTLGVTGVLTGTSLDISGDIDVDGTTNLDNTDIDGTLNVQGETTLQTHLFMGDSDEIKLGAGVDMKVFSDGTNGVLRADNGRVYVQTDTGVNLTKLGNAETMLIATPDGSVDLYHDNSKKFETTSSGVTVTGGVTTTTASSIEGGAVFNESSADVDFRVEGNGYSHTLFVQGGSNKVGIGDSSPNSYNNYASNLVINNGGDSNGHVGMTIACATDKIGSIYFADGTSGNAAYRGAIYYNHSEDRMYILQAGAGSIYIHGTGQVAIGQTTNEATLCIFGHQQSYTGLQIKNGTNNGSTLFAVFKRSNGTAAGSIQQSSDGATTAFNTTSDYRLKESISYDFDATTRLKQLKPCRFVFKESLTGQTVDGFLAHEVSDVVSEAVTGEKDAMKDVSDVVLNSDGTVLSQGVSEEEWIKGKSDKTYASNTTWTSSKSVVDAQSIDQSKLVPLLVKTIQELEARITALESA
jgi:hypothetical protein